MKSKGTQWPRFQQFRSGPHREGHWRPHAGLRTVPSRRLTSRSTGHATAWHPGRAAALVIIGRTARAPRRCVPVNFALGLALNTAADHGSPMKTNASGASARVGKSSPRVQTTPLCTEHCVHCCHCARGSAADPTVTCKCSASRDASAPESTAAEESVSQARRPPGTRAPRPAPCGRRRRSTLRNAAPSTRLAASLSKRRCWLHHCHACQGPAARPNRSFNRTRHGMAPWPCARLCLSSAARPGRHAVARRLTLR